MLLFFSLSGSNWLSLVDKVGLSTFIHCVIHTTHFSHTLTPKTISLRFKKMFWEILFIYLIMGQMTVAGQSSTQQPCISELFISSGEGTKTIY